jgi:hypothetical protein
MRPVCAFQMYAIIRFNENGQKLVSCHHDESVAKDLASRMSDCAKPTTKYVIEKAFVVLTDMDLTPAHFIPPPIERLNASPIVDAAPKNNGGVSMYKRISEMKLKNPKMKPNEIAVALGTTRDYVYTCLFKERQKLKDHLRIAAMEGERDAD